MDFNLIDATDQYLEESYTRFDSGVDGRDGKRYWPSEASVEFIENGRREVLGKCLRQLFYSHIGVQASDPLDARAARLLTVGKLVEQQEIQWTKEAGLYWGSNVKFRHSVDPIIISGEVDLFIKRPDTQKVEGVEIKTGYGYYFNKQVMGNSRYEGKPKDDHLMQVMLYLAYYKEVPLFRLIYIDRGDLTRKEYIIKLIPSDMTDERSRKDWLVSNNYIDNTYLVSISSVSGRERVETRFSLQSLYNRFLELQNKVEKEIVPRRDYTEAYSSSEIERKYKAGDISKSKYEKWNKTGASIGDWQCIYCKFRKICAASSSEEHSIAAMPKAHRPESTLQLV